MAFFNTFKLNFFHHKWWGWRDSNSYASRRWNLNPVRLPISPQPHYWNYDDVVLLCGWLLYTFFTAVQAIFQFSCKFFSCDLITDSSLARLTGNFAKSDPNRVCKSLHCRSLIPKAVELSVGIGSWQWAIAHCSNVLPKKGSLPNSTA